MKFCTAITCMDGRIQLPVIEFLQRRFGVDYVDIVSEPGPNAIIAAGEDRACIDSIEKRALISVERHRSRGIAVVGHADCAGNPTGESVQRGHTEAAVAWVKRVFAAVPAIGLWIDEDGDVTEIC